MTRGQVWEYVLGSRQYRVLIISNDEFNEVQGLAPWALLVDRDDPARPRDVDLWVPLGADGPVPAGVVAIDRVVRLDRTALRANLGFVSDTAMNAVERGLREFLVLP